LPLAGGGLVDKRVDKRVDKTVDKTAESTRLSGVVYCLDHPDFD
jgi:hypothetical protein